MAVNDAGGLRATIQGLESYSFGGDGEILRGRGQLSRPLEFEAQETLRGSHREHIYQVDLVLSRAVESTASLSVYRQDNGWIAELAIACPGALFESLRQHSAAEISVRFDPENHDFSLVGGGYASRVEIQHFAATLALAPSSSVVIAPRELLPSVVHDPDGSDQLSVVAKELLQSAQATIATDRAQKYNAGGYRGAIRHIIFTLRAGVPRKTQEERYAYSLDPKDFRKHLQGLEEDAAHRLGDYDHLAFHASMLGMLAGKTKVESKDLIETDRVEDAAQRYLSMKGLKSPTLEWILIDQLLLTEVVGFGWAIPPSAAILNGRRPSVVEALNAGRRLVGEALYLCAAYVLANFVDSRHSAGFWTVMGVLTLARWLSPKLRAKEKLRKWQLLADMAACQEQLHREDFNPRLLRESLYDVCKRGAVFSPTVFALLDKRIARKAA